MLSGDIIRMALWTLGVRFHTYILSIMARGYAACERRQRQYAGDFAFEVISCKRKFLSLGWLAGGGRLECEATALLARLLVNSLGRYKTFVQAVVGTSCAVRFLLTTGYEEAHNALSAAKARLRQASGHRGCNQ